MKKMSKIFIILAAGFLVLSCKSLQAKSEKPSLQQNKPEMVTAVKFAKTCPVSSGPLKQSFGTSLGLAVIPPLVESAVKGLGGIIKAAGESKEKKVNGYGRMDFYGFNDQKKIIETNENFRCLIVFNALVDNNQKIDKAFLENTAFKVGGNPASKEKSVEAGYMAKKLYDDYGIIKTPRFYYEAIVRVSNDKTKFYLDPQMIYYGNNVAAKKSTGSLVFNLAFGTPTATGEDKVFSVHTMAITRDDKAYLVNNVKLLNKYQSKYLPLPTITQRQNALLTVYKEQLKQLQDFKKQKQEIAKDAAPELFEEINQLQKLVDGHELVISNLTSDIALVKKLCAIEKSCDTTKVKVKMARLEHKLEKTEKDEKYHENKSNLEEKQGALKEKLERNKRALRKNLNEAIGFITKKIKYTKRLLSNTAPVNVSVSMIETTKPNKFLVTLGEAIAGASDTVKQEVVNRLTPEDPDSVRDQANKDAEALVGVRVAAITEVDHWLKAKDDYDSDNTKLGGLRTAYYKAKAKCDIVKSYNITEPYCVLLTEPPLVN